MRVAATTGIKPHEFWEMTFDEFRNWLEGWDTADFIRAKRVAVIMETLTGKPVDPDSDRLRPLKLSLKRSLKRKKKRLTKREIEETREWLRKSRN